MSIDPTPTLTLEERRAAVLADLAVLRATYAHLTGGGDPYDHQAGPDDSALDALAQKIAAARAELASIEREMAAQRAAEQAAYCARLYPRLEKARAALLKAADAFDARMTPETWGEVVARHAEYQVLARDIRAHKGRCVILRAPQDALKLRLAGFYADLTRTFAYRDSHTMRAALGFSEEE